MTGCGPRRPPRRLAGFCGAAGAPVFSSGYLANLAVVTALAGVLGAARPGQRGGTPIVSDERNHASLIDACGWPAPGQW